MPSNYVLVRAMRNTTEKLSYATDEANSVKHGSEFYEELSRKWERYRDASFKILALTKTTDRPRTCGTCLRWFMRADVGHHAWVRCTSEKVKDAHYIHCESNEYIHPAMFNRMAEDLELRTEENTFGCIHHEAMPEDKED